MKGAEILVQTLIEQGVCEVFGYPGGNVVDIYDALYEAGDSIRHFMTAHEQGAAHAADGYARATGKPGVVIATSGPGATNLVTGIATAMLDSVPMVAITGNVATGLIGRDAFQEVDITGITMPITKHNYFVSDVCELADTLREAFQVAISGRPGPVLVDIPLDVQKAQCDFVPAPRVQEKKQKRAKQCYIDEAVQLINKAKRPYIYIGGGAAGRGMTGEIMRFAEKIKAFIGCSLMGLSAFRHDYERFLGMEGMHGKYASTAACRDADLIIAIGVRFSDRATGNADRFAKNTAIIHIDTDLAEINKNVLTDVGIVGDMADTLERICEKCVSKRLARWQAHVQKLRAYERSLKQAELATEGLTPAKVISVINSAKTADTIIATDVGQHQMWAAQHIELSKPRHFLTSGGLGTMGYGLGAAIGASIATGEKTVLITGDGSFGMNLNELATAVSYRIPVVIVIFNNHTLGMVRQWQTLFFENHYYETDLDRKTDFVLLAEAFGAKGGRATNTAQLESLLKEAIHSEEPFVIDVCMPKDELVLPMLPAGGSIEDIITADPRESKK